MAEERVFDFANIDRRIIYLLVFLALSMPILFRWALPAPPMESAKQYFQIIDGLQREKGRLVLLFLDFGPNSKAENFPQSEVVIEHLLRKRIPFALMSQYLQADPLLESIPQAVVRRLEAEAAGERWEYGIDWINLGYRPGGWNFIQSFARAKSLKDHLQRDARGNNLSDLHIFDGTGNITSLSLVAQFSSLVGTLDTLLQFFQTEEYRPQLLHGCTSISIPQAFNFLDSKQIGALLEGIAGAGSYATMLRKAYPARAKDKLEVTITSLGVAHAIVMLLVIIGNVALLARRGRSHA